MFGYIVSVVALTIAVIFDLKYRKIPNLLTFSVMVLGISHSFFLGLEGILSSFFGILLVFGLFFVPFYLKILGAGDVKLMMALSSIYGYHSTRMLISAIVISGVLISAIILVREKRLKKVVIKTSTFIRNMIFLNEIVELKTEGESHNRYYPYSISIAVGYISYCVLVYEGVLY